MTHRLAATVCWLCLAGGSPDVLWRVAGGGASVPAAADAAVYFLGGHHDLVAVSARTGQVEWRVTTGAPGESTNGSSVVVAGANVIAGDYDIRAFSRATGHPVWRFTPMDGYGPGLFLGDAARGAVFAGSPSGRLYSIDADSGTQRWSLRLAPETATVHRPAVSGNLVAAPYTEFTAPIRGGLAIVDAATGRVRWRKSFDAPVPGFGSGFGGGPVFDDDVVIVGDVDGEITAFAAEDGRPRWSLPPLDDPSSGRGPRRDFRALARTGSTLVAASLTGTVVAYDLTSRQERWRYHGGLHGSAQLRITADGETVVVPYLSGELVGLDARTGQERWRMDAESFALPPLLDGPRAYAVGAGGFYALSLSKAVRQ